MAGRQPFGSGVVADDGRLHATIRRWGRRRALCGAGRIQLALRGEFNPHDFKACPSCAQAARARSAQRPDEPA